MTAKLGLPKELCLAPMPAEVKVTGGVLRIPAEISLYEETPSAFSKTVRIELSARKETAADAATVRLLSPKSVPGALKRQMANPEGYGIRIDCNGICIWAATGSGHLYGVMTLRQLIRQYGHRLPHLLIADAPVFSNRGVQLSFPQGHTVYRRSYMKHLIPHLALWKINEIYLYLESFFDFPSLPHMAGPGAMTPADAKALDKLCRAYNIKVIPMLNTLAHCGELLATQRYQHLSEYDPASEDRRLVRPFNLCACSKEVHRLVNGILNDLCDCFSSDVIHVGGDEVSVIGKCPRCQRDGKGQDAFSLYVEYFDRVLGALQKRGRKGGLWGDMFLKYGKDMPPSKLRRLFKPFVDRAVIYDWHYSGGSPDSLRFFGDTGLTTIACSSTHLCYSSGMWPFQHRNQWELFRDAAKANVAGGMTTAWCNWNGLHEEHFNYLHATGGCMLWSGPDRTDFARNLRLETFEKAYSLQRYGIKSKALIDYIHTIGDAGGPILGVLAPLHGVELRKCLYHTDNPLLFWTHYARILANGGLEQYKAGVAKARRLWECIERQPSKGALLELQVGPLLMHEHLIARYEMTEDVYRDYDAAAKAQYHDPSLFRQLLDRMSTKLKAHLTDFKPIDEYLAMGRKAVGFDRSTSNRVSATKRNIRELAAFMRHLKKSHRPLPAFQQLGTILLRGDARTRWYGDREHEWAAEEPRFLRYTMNQNGPWRAVEATQQKESTSRNRTPE